MTAPDVDCEQHHAGIAVRDIAAAIDFYTNKQKLKAKYGIDYDSHASYRFVEE
jgi:catechol 2,3-dioxygenase-like lactoylglutathione lyase family enzyme